MNPNFWAVWVLLDFVGLFFCVCFFVCVLVLFCLGFLLWLVWFGFLQESLTEVSKRMQEEDQQHGELSPPSHPRYISPRRWKRHNGEQVGHPCTKDTLFTLFAGDKLLRWVKKHMEAPELLCVLTKPNCLPLFYSLSFACHNPNCPDM